MIREFLQKVLEGRNLEIEEATRAMDLIMDGKATPTQIAGLIIALKQKGESVEEVTGFVRSMRDHAVKIKLADKNAVDGCGTGGDGAHTFNISTAATLVASAAGVTIAKHGNRSISSQCGSADLLEAAGGAIDPDHEIVENNINEIGFGFMFAPRFHPAMKHAAGPRKELGVRTIFNILGPMTNPASVTRQVIGVYDRTLMPLVAEVLKALEAEHVLVVHSDDGLDEFSISTPSDYIELKERRISRNRIEPEDIGLQSHPAGVLSGGDASTNLNILYQVLACEQSGYLDAVLLNAGAIIYVSGQADSISRGVQAAKEAIGSGKASNKLQQWVQASNK